jgi:predicted nucleotidyltransferase
MATYIDIFKALEKHRVRYLVVGGVAVNLLGVSRSTADLDLFVCLDPENLMRFAKAVEEVEYRPKLPVKMLDFADAECRRRWREEKGMLVFSFWNPKDPLALVDVFVDEPMPFTEMDRRKVRMTAEGVTIPVASPEDLIVLKERCDRPKDRYDVDGLREAVRLRKSTKGKR